MHKLLVDDAVDITGSSSMRGQVALFSNNFMSHFVNLCVIANTVALFVQLQVLGMVANTSLGIATYNGWSTAEFILQALEYFFTAVYIVDLALQLYAFRLSHFRSVFNIMDSAIVVITSLEVFILTPLASSVGNVSVVRLLRLAKVSRAVKVVRTLKSFESLRVLVAVMWFSIGSCFWSLVFLFVFQIMGSVFMCHSLHDFIIDASQDLALRVWVNDMYGDGLKSFWTIFELTFSGCWPTYARRIVEEISPLYSLFFFMYVYVVVFVATRIVAALLMKETLSQYSNDAECMVNERAKKSSWVKASLSDLFEEADTDNDGLLSVKEMRALFAHQKVKLWMKELGVDANDPDTLICLLGDGDGCGVNQDDFLHGITRLKGEARSQDLLPVYSHVKKTHALVKDLHITVDRLVQEKGTMGIVSF